MQTLKILSIDDDPDIRAIIAMALSGEEGLELRLCASGPEALAMAPDYRPDLVLLDGVMPGMDGQATLQALRALPECAATPIVFMTAKAQPDELQELLALGAAAVIVKPFDPMGLADQLTALWRQHRPSR